MVFSNSEDGDDDFPDEEVIKPPKSVFGKLKPTGVGPGASPAARKRRSLALKKAAQELADKYKAEVILGIHSRTEKTKSWYFKAFGPQMLAFLNSSNGKRIQTDFKTVSDSWGLDDMNQVTQSKNNQVDGAFVSALGEEAINLAQQRGATKEKEKAELQRLKDESRRKRMSLVLWEKKSSKNAKASSLRTGTATVDAGNQLPSLSTRKEDPLIAPPTNPHAKAGNSGFAGTRKSPFKVTDVIQKIGHIYRKYAPFPNSAKGDFVGRNYKRVAEVWMDEYKEYLYLRRPQYRNLEVGDLSAQNEIRERLQCKSFKWFMKNIAFDLPKKYPPVEPPDFASGKIRSKADSTLCVDTQFKKENERFNLEQCVKDGSGRSGEQQFSLTWHKDIRPHKRTMCWDVSSLDAQAPVLLWGCHGSQGKQLWRYDPETLQLIHGGNPRCLDCDPGRKELYVATCNNESPTQRWTFERFNQTALLRWNKAGIDEV